MPRHEFSDEYIENFKSLFKVHGDVHYYLKYIEKEELIFNKRQYIESIKSNKKMLSKLKDDFSNNNILFIGCSLDEEPDLMSIVTETIKLKNNESQVFYLTSKVLDNDKRDLLEDYGVTSCIIVNNFNKFYMDVVELCLHNPKAIDPIDFYMEPAIEEISKKDSSINFLLNSNAAIHSPFDQKIYKPYYFISREDSVHILNSLKYVSPIHILYGHRISGKTFCLVDLYQMIKDKTRFFFPSNTRIDSESIDKLFSKTDCAFFFDSNCLEPNQIFNIVKKRKLFEKNNNYIVITINSSDRNSLDLISENTNYCSTGIKNILSRKENDKINQRLQNCNIPTFVSHEKVYISHKKRCVDYYHSILDNLCKIASDFSYNDTTFVLPDLSAFCNIREIALLILLATQQVLSSYEQYYFGVEKESQNIAKAYPIHFQMSVFDYNLSRNDSKTKIFVNSRFYLLKYLGEYAKQEKNYKHILSAYKYIYEQISDAEYGEQFISRKMLDFIKFDVLSDVFHMDNRSVIKIIKYIYEGLEDVMNINPQFKHQRAKSIFWLCPNEIDEMAEAVKYIDLSRYDIENILKTKYNEKLKISLEHVKYTQASIYGRYCNLQGYNDEKTIIKAIHLYDEAINAEENFDERIALMEQRAEKHIYQDLIDLIKYIIDSDLNSDVRNTAINLAKGLNFDDLIPVLC